MLPTRGAAAARLLTPLLLLAAALRPAMAQEAQETPRLLREWVVGLQYADPTLPSFGAVRVHHTHGLASVQGRYFRVSAYEANLGLTGLLRVSGADAHRVAERWIDWYLLHTVTAGQRSGVVLDHWYREDGRDGTTCPPAPLAPAPPAPCDHVDAADRGAATFLRLLDAYQATGGSASFLRDPARRIAIRRVAELLLRLQQPDGLTRADFHDPVSYLVGNSEAYAGLRSIARLEAELFGEPVAAVRYARAAERVRSGIRARLFDRAAGVYRVALHPDGASEPADLRRWYPDAVAQLWPVLFGVTDRVPARASALAAPPVPSAAAAYAALLAGDSVAALRQAARMAEVERVSAPEARFPWPFSVADGGWLLLALRPLERPAP